MPVEFFCRALGHMHGNGVALAQYLKRGDVVTMLVRDKYCSYLGNIASRLTQSRAQRASAFARIDKYARSARTDKRAISARA
jgi:hypothetical protein